MIRARMQAGDRTMVLLGVSHDNIAALFANEPIIVDSAELGVEGGPLIALVAGKDEQAILAQLAPSIRPSTKTTVEYRSASQIIEDMGTL